MLKVLILNRLKRKRYPFYLKKQFREIAIWNLIIATILLALKKNSLLTYYFLKILNDATLKKKKLENWDFLFGFVLVILTIKKNPVQSKTLQILKKKLHFYELLFCMIQMDTREFYSILNKKWN